MYCELDFNILFDFSYLISKLGCPCIFDCYNRYYFFPIELNERT